MIAIYTKPDCQPCRAAKRAMTAAGITFAEMSAEEHVELLSGLGYRAAPVTIAGDRHWQGYRPDLIAGLAARAAGRGGEAS